MQSGSVQLPKIGILPPSRICPDVVADWHTMVIPLGDGTDEAPIVSKARKIPKEAVLSALLAETRLVLEIAI